MAESITGTTVTAQVAAPTDIPEPRSSARTTVQPVTSGAAISPRTWADVAEAGKREAYLPSPGNTTQRAVTTAEMAVIRGEADKPQNATDGYELSPPDAREKLILIPQRRRI